MTTAILEGYEMSRRDRQRQRRTFRASTPRVVAPDVVARTGPDTWGVDGEAVKLPANADVEASRDYAGKVTRAMRYDVFSLLFFNPNSRLRPQSYDAVRRFQGDLAVLHRTQGAVDTQRTTGKGATGALALVTEDFSHARVRAGEQVEAVLNGWRTPTGMFVVGMEPWAARLMRDLCEAEVIRGSPPNWQAVVQKQTGITERHARGEIVRTACDDLAESYRRIDNEPKRASA